ncbi:hypothetical protein J6590_096293 [Homalodisca vitripennis]|nr:hypothetical protein J6590_096293 [Homalodisca vitripennis]
MAQEQLRLPEEEEADTEDLVTPGPINSQEKRSQEFYQPTHHSAPHIVAPPQQNYSTYNTSVPRYYNNPYGQGAATQTWNQNPSVPHFNNPYGQVAATQTSSQGPAISPAEVLSDNYKKTERKKEKSGQGALSQRRYLYARQLSFLQQTIETVPTENSIVKEEENENDNDNNDDIISPHKNSSDQATSETPTDDPSDNLEKYQQLNDGE